MRDVPNGLPEDKASTNTGAAGFSSTISSGSSQAISITDIISEGPIYGLVHGGSSVFLNDDRAQELGVAPIRGAGATVVFEGTTVVFENAAIPASPEGTSKSVVVKGGQGSTVVTVEKDPLSSTGATVSKVTSEVPFFTDEMVHTPARSQAASYDPAPVRLVNALTGEAYEGVIIARVNETSGELP
jgi:hypothetical protein